MKNNLKSVGDLVNFYLIQNYLIDTEKSICPTTFLPKYVQTYLYVKIMIIGSESDQTYLNLFFHNKLTKHYKSGIILEYSPLQTNVKILSLDNNEIISQALKTDGDFLDPHRRYEQDGYIVVKKSIVKEYE